MSSPSTARPDPDVVETDLGDGELALLHLRTKTYFTLNRSGTRIWFHLKQGSSLPDVSLKLQEEFEVDAARAEQSVHTLVEALLRHGLVLRP